MTIDQTKVRETVKVLGIALFAAQAKELVRFPAGLLTIGEIESRVEFILMSVIAQAEALDVELD